MNLPLPSVGALCNAIIQVDEPIANSSEAHTNLVMFRIPFERLEAQSDQALNGKLPALKKIVGIDIDKPAVERGLRKILKHSELVADRQPGVELYAGNIACPEACQEGDTFCFLLIYPKCLVDLCQSKG